MTYEQFIKDRLTKQDNLENFHKHHIVPRSIGGTNDPDNIIKLSWADHWFAHKLLAMENPDNKAIVTGFKHMGSLGAHLKRAKSLSLNNGMGGKNHSEETRLKMSESHKGKEHTEHQKMMMSINHGGKYAQTIDFEKGVERYFALKKEREDRYYRQLYKKEWKEFLKYNSICSRSQTKAVADIKAYAKEKGLTCRELGELITENAKHKKVFNELKDINFSVWMKKVGKNISRKELDIKYKNQDGLN